MKTTKHIAALLAALVLALSLTACGQTAAKDDPMNPAIPVADGAEIGEGSKTFTTVHEAILYLESLAGTK